MKHQHYFKNVKHLDHIDIYRVIDLYAIHDPCLQHALKKVACAGGRGAKDQAKDVQEAIDTLLRWQEMQAENSLVAEPTEWQDKELASSGIYEQGGFVDLGIRKGMSTDQVHHILMQATGKESFRPNDDGAVTIGEVPAKRWRGFVAKELRPLLYSDEGYSADDLIAASLVHDFETK